MSDHRRARLLPTGLTWICPCCGHCGEAETAEDESGRWAVAAEDRFLRCYACDAPLDIGWADWPGHDPG